MQNEFVPYQESLELKELGFDEPCFSVYYNGEYHEHGIQNQFLHEKNECSAPTFSQCFRFFREKYKLHHQVTQYYGEHFYYKIEDMVHPRRYEEYPIEKLRNFGEYTSQEEAELECLVKLIEIVKNQTKN